MRTINQLLLEISDSENLDRASIIDALALCIEDWLEYRTEELFSKLYRLDISEDHIKETFSSPNVSKAIAALIYERQLQKIISRKQYPASGAPDDLKW